MCIYREHKVVVMVHACLNIWASLPASHAFRFQMVFMTGIGSEMTDGTEYTADHLGIRVPCQQITFGCCLGSDLGAELEKKL